LSGQPSAFVPIFLPPFSWRLHACPYRFAFPLPLEFVVFDDRDRGGAQTAIALNPNLRHLIALLASLMDSWKPNLNF
jgi:hypothetical protein